MGLCRYPGLDSSSRHASPVDSNSVGDDGLSPPQPGTTGTGETGSHLNETDLRAHTDEISQMPRGQSQTRVNETAFEVVRGRRRYGLY